MVRILALILSRLLDNEQLTNRLAESYPIKRAAQFLVYYYNKGKMTALEFKNVQQLEGLSLVEKLKKINEELMGQNKKVK